MKITRLIYVAVILSNVLILTMSSTYAKTTFKDITVNCAPSFVYAYWQEYRGKPNTQFVLTTIGMEIFDEEEIITKWHDFDNYIYHGDRHGLHNAFALVLAKCIPSGESIRMFSFEFKPSPPTLICEKGKGVAIRFLAPEDPDPSKFIFHALLTIIKNEPELTQDDIATIKEINRAKITTASSSGSNSVGYNNRKSQQANQRQQARCIKPGCTILSLPITTFEVMHIDNPEIKEVNLLSEGDFCR